MIAPLVSVSPGQIMASFRLTLALFTEQIRKGELFVCLYRRISNPISHCLWRGKEIFIARICFGAVAIGVTLLRCNNSFIGNAVIVMQNLICTECKQIGQFEMVHQQLVAVSLTIMPALWRPGLQSGYWRWTHCYRVCDCWFTLGLRWLD